jgi:steroid delta-isomerase-like uncharacterized protein
MTVPSKAHNNTEQGLPWGVSVASDEELSEQMMTAMRSNDPAMQLSGKAGLRTAVEYFFAAFHMREIEIEEVIRQGPTLIIRSRWQAVHQGEYLGVPPSGKVFATWNIMWLVVRDGKIISDTSVWDSGELRRLEQLATET